MTVSPLSDSITFKKSGFVAKNRFLKSAMTERLCTFSQEDHGARGKSTPEYVRLYEEWGKGEIGVIVLGNIPIDRTALEAAGNIVIDKRSSFDPVENIKPVIEASKAHGSIIIGQLTHGGRQTSENINSQPLSASDIQCPSFAGMAFAEPKPASLEEIDAIVEGFAYGAEVLYKAGAHGAQLHGAHGYLLSQFLSARINKRTDDYGGSLENRMRIIIRIINEIKQRIPEDKFILSIKMNSADFADGGLTPEESSTVAQQLDKLGLDLIELSGGSYESMAFEHKKESTIKREGYFIEFAEHIRPHLTNAVLAVTGGFRGKAAMERAVAESSTDIIGLARPLTAEPCFCRDILSGAISEAKPNKVPTAVQTGTSIAQIGAIGHGKSIPDLSDEKSAQECLDAVMGKAPPKQKVDGHNTTEYAGQKEE
ncbi:nadh oxidase [Phaffia rhodozyma]|uniref:Nadh oxidase n=1 Tax=Phaffia rhodozyma TaxID=264483 RepID=A0A0F7SEG3_PHARH|nr:nadh oxidase [Phaffia rhodozyma]